jgi:subtilisin family serine protease
VTDASINFESKISPAFKSLLAESGPNDRHEGIVVYRTPTRTAHRPARGNVLEIRRRLKAVRTKAQSQVESALFDDVQKLNKKAVRGEPPTIQTVGGNTLPIAAIEVTRTTLPEIAKRPDVVAVMPNQRVRLIRPQSVDYLNLQSQENKDGLTWGLKQLNIPEVWEQTKGAKVRVGVLDTGVYGQHPALIGRVKEFVVIDSACRRIEATAPFDCSNHGTHVCGTIAGGKADGKVSIGVAPEAELVVGAVLVGDSTLQMLLEGIAWAVEKGANVLSMSLGFDRYEPKFAVVFQDLIDEYGILSVVAIGNENHGNSSSPGNAQNALSVGAAEKMPGGKLDIASFSSGASLVFPGSEPNALVTKPDLAAPGVQVYSAVPPTRSGGNTFNFTYMDGTSMATPHVAGVAALLMSARPNVPVEHLISVMKSTAKHPETETNRPDNRWGYGMVNVVEALKALG